MMQVIIGLSLKIGIPYPEIEKLNISVIRNYLAYFQYVQQVGDAEEQASIAEKIKRDMGFYG